MIRAVRTDSTCLFGDLRAEERTMQPSWFALIFLIGKCLDSQLAAAYRIPNDF
jgi:hypothetical protein